MIHQPNCNRDMKTFYFRLISLLLVAFFSAHLHAQHSVPACEVVEKVVTLEKGSIKYFMMGSGQPVLLLHGLFAQKEQWADFACELSGAGFVVYAPDLPGYGQSTGFPIEDYQLSNEVDLLHRFVRKLDIPPLHIAGNSMGGAIAAIYSSQYPSDVLSLGFIGAPLGIIGWSPQVRNAIVSGTNPFIPTTISQFDLEMSLLFAKPPLIPDGVKQQILREYTVNNLHYQKVWNIVNLDLNVFELIKKFSKPTFIVWGAEDGIFNIAGRSLLDKKFQKPTSYAIPNASHLIMLEKPVEMASLYRSFLECKRVK